MSSRDFSTALMIREKTYMGADIVSNVDREYSFYAGAIYSTAKKLAQIDFLLKNKEVLELDTVTISALKIARAYYQQQRKAELGSLCDILTKLSFIQGEKKISKSGQKKVKIEV